MEKNARITVVGIGGVGGYIGALLSKAYPQVTLVARGERKRVLEEKGICLFSEFSGDISVKPAHIVESSRDIREIQDFVFLCVKNYSLEEACRDLKSCVGKDTIVVPVMNGADTGERTRSYLGTGRVLEAVIYITSFFNKDYSVTQLGRYGKIQIGSVKKSKEQEQAAAEALECMRQADLDCHVCENIESAVWEKYIFNCAYNVLTAYYMEMAEEIQASPEKCLEFYQLLEEACAVAEAKEISVREGYLDSEYRRFRKLDAGSTSSLKRDLEAGRQSELETFSGFLISEAARYGVKVPLSEKMYQELKKRG